MGQVKVMEMGQGKRSLLFLEAAEVKSPQTEEVGRKK